MEKEDRINDFEKKHKEFVYGKISELIDSQHAIINSMEESFDNESSLNIQNTAITTNNKIVELSNYFRKAGLSMFSKFNDVDNIIESSFIGDTIIIDLTSMLGESNALLEEFNYRVEAVVERINERIEQLQKGFVKRRLLRMGAISVNDLIPESEQERLAYILDEYEYLDSKIWNYNLENDLVPALFNAIISTGIVNGDNVPELLRSLLESDLKKLGLAHLLPKLQDLLIQELSAVDNNSSRR